MKVRVWHFLIALAVAVIANIIAIVIYEKYINKKQKL